MILERARRFERPTLTLARLCSTPELRPHSVGQGLLAACRQCKGEAIGFLPQCYDFYQALARQCKRAPRGRPLLNPMERARRFERPTLTLARLCSTPELRPHSVGQGLLAACRQCKGEAIGFLPQCYDFYQALARQCKRAPRGRPLLNPMERARRFERPTLTLARLCSTPELRPHRSDGREISEQHRPCKSKNA